MAESRKRRNFSEEEDVMLLKQALADEPFRHEHGKVMEAWDSLATTLAACPDFTRKNLSGKTAQNRANALLASAQKKNSESARRSGVTESHTEKDTLLDELLSKIEDIKVEKANKKRIKAEETAAQESAGETIRRLAVERLNRQRDDDQADVNESPSHGNKFAKLVDLLREHKEKELAARPKQWEEERLDRQATACNFWSC
ncbi:hypothetical protein PR003_g12171 [Phytophthora rubi]|uniref:Myb-like domain-containing protein n=1 Tax=Phytophthora rubi TaxID=129364 RepID=A0A6A3NYE4_9STRA|nr:hypothetical protein PR001_g5017 [Phytophthora rubi]KAE9046555.1 hypothetical protein PR002_g1588 [Phytophthora rubi]KAE9337102.1 hypothetical protein PR003_g12171 [Phytophthora rubi]